MEMQPIDSVAPDAVQAPPCYDAVVVDRDNRRLGFLQHRGPNAIEAFASNEQPIGTYPDEQVAVSMIWHHARGQAVWP
jgi:hypothetical protein